MQKNVTSELKRDDLVHVLHAGRNIFEVADPDVVGERVSLKPEPRILADAGITGNVALMQAQEFIEQHDGLNHVGRVSTHRLFATRTAVFCVTAHRPRGMRRVALVVVPDQRVGTADGCLQIFRVAGHFVKAEIGVAVFADDVRLDVVGSVGTPAFIVASTRIGRGVGHAGPGIIRWSRAMLEFIVHEVFEEGQHARIAGVGIEALDKALQHGAEVSRGVGPFLVGKEFVGGAVNVEAAVEIRQALAIVLIPENSPLRKNVRGIGIADVVGHRPREKFSLRVECDWPTRDGGLVND